MFDKTKPDFDTFYKEQIEQPLLAIELIRAKAFRWFLILIGASIVMGILLVLLILLFPNPLLIFLSIAATIAFLGFANDVMNRTQEKITPLFKNATMLPMLKFLFEDVVYIPRQKIPCAVVNESLLLSTTIDYVKGDDYVYCSIGDTTIQFSDLDGFSAFGKSKFGGLFLSVEFNKNFATKTIVIPRKFSNKPRKYLFHLNKRMKNAVTITLENTAFQKKFITLGESQIESRYILTPGLMQRILAYDQKVKKRMSMSFIDNTMFFAIPYNQFLFEPRLYKPTNDKTFVMTNYDVFKLIADVVEDLDLNTRIWQKE